jgi:hypothetical protein
MSDTNRPLWEVMQAASVEAVFVKSKEDLPVSRVRIAAELRAIAEEAPKATGLLSLTPTNIDTLVSWLLAEADRAEAGE